MAACIWSVLLTCGCLSVVNPALFPRPVLGSFSSREVPESSEVPSDDSVSQHVRCMYLGLPCLRAVQDSSEVPFDDSVSHHNCLHLVRSARVWFQNPRRFSPETLSPITLCAVALLGFSLSPPAGSLLDPACLLDGVLHVLVAFLP